MITKENKKEEIVSSEMPVLIEFFSNWCASCKLVSPIVDLVASELTNEKIVKVDIDEYPELAEEFAIKSIPTFVLFKDGKEQHRHYGAKSKKAIIDMFKG